MNAATEQRQNRVRQRVATVLVTVLLGAALGVGTAVVTPSPAMACTPPSYPDGNGNCVLNPGGGRPSSTRPGDPGDPGSPGDGDGSGTPQPACPDWVLMGGYDSAPAHIRPYSWDDAPPGSTFYYDACTSPNGFAPGSTTMWLPPGEALPAPPTPAEVAEGIWVELQETLLRPALVTSPPEGTRAVLDIPTFVAVSNWQGEITRDRCELGVCVSLTATPELHFDPGEPGSDVIVCDPPGTYFDPEGAEPDVQAEDGCAYSYQQRTGVAGRPGEWPGVVSVVWDVQWEETGGGQSGDFDLTLSTDLPRAVQEAPTVVVDTQG